MNKYKKETKRLIILLLQIIFIFIIIYSSLRIFEWHKENRHNENIISQIEESITIDNVNSKLNINFQKLKKINTDVKAYVKVRGTDIEYPVVKGTDNNFYLEHSLDKEKNSAGWVFTDYRNKLDGTDKNIIIYGHNRKDGSMFRTLRNIFEEEWYSKEENRQIIFITENESFIYEVFSIYKILDEDYYITTDFADTITYNNFLKTISSRSRVDFGVKLTENDKILTLSTCDNNNKYRVVLHAKEL